MALSEEEQRLLDALEASLAADDPKLADKMRNAPSSGQVHRKAAALAGVGFFFGLFLLVIGIQINPLVSVAGFVFMLGSTAVAVKSWRHVNDEPGGSAARARAAEANKMSSANSATSFMDRFERRWRDRHEGQH